MARALVYAHAHGVVHRDIKPDNVLLSGGAALVTDFGVAKAVTASATGANSTTLTQLGVALGTPAYMSPEQAAADPAVDARADLYAFGCMAYEMLSGGTPFAGRPASAQLAAHVAEQPEPVQRRRPNVPGALAELVMQCLEKRPADRPRDAATLQRALEGVVVTPHTTASVSMPAHDAPTATPTVVLRPARARLARLAPWLVAAALFGALALTTLRDRSTSTASSSAPLPQMRFTIPLPAGWHIGRIAYGMSPIALSPDGRSLALRLTREDTTHLFLRPLDGTEWKAVPGSDGALGASFSDDGRWLVYRKSGETAVVRLPLEGGMTTQLVESRWSGTLAANGTTYFTPNFDAGLASASSPGATPTTLTTPDRAQRELGHWWPQLLPDGKHLLFSVYTSPLSDARIDVLTLGSNTRTTATRGGTLARVVGDVLLYVNGSGLQAAHFDAATLKTTSAAQPVLDGFAADVSAGAAAYAVSESGTLAYVPAQVQMPDRELVWVDRAGRATPVGAKSGPYLLPRLSPDGARVALLRHENGFNTLWVYEMARGVLTPLTRREANARALAWSPDGRELFYNVETPTYDVYRRASDAATAERLVSAAVGDKIVDDVTPDGHAVIVEHTTSRLRDTRLAALDVSSGGEPRSLDVGERGSTQGKISPDGRWIAFTSAESGDMQVYLRSYPDVGRVRRQVSAAGGRTPRWTRGGRELLFVQGASMMSAAVDPATGAVSRPVKLFEASFLSAGELGTFDVTADGSRIIALNVAADQPEYVVVVANWLQNVRASLARNGR